MGQVISDVDASSFAPTAQIKTDGAMLKGRLVSRIERKTKWGAKPVYSVTVVDATCKFLKGKDEVFPNAGDKVEFFAPTRLERQLAQVPLNSGVTIKYMGRKDTGGANPAHSFHVEVE